MSVKQLGALLLVEPHRDDNPPTETEFPRDKIFFKDGLQPSDDFGITFYASDNRETIGPYMYVQTGAEAEEYVELDEEIPYDAIPDHVVVAVNDRTLRGYPHVFWATVFSALCTKVTVSYLHDEEENVEFTVEVIDRKLTGRIALEQLHGALTRSES